jgi:thymidylate synthase (FAD)
MQDPKNRQNSLELNMASDLDARELSREWHIRQLDIINAAKSAYEWAINNGIAKEQARAVLPEGLTISKLYMAGTLRSWIHYIQLRSANGTQKEHIEIAKACAGVIAEIFPLTTQFVSK